MRDTSLLGSTISIVAHKCLNLPRTRSLFVDMFCVAVGAVTLSGCAGNAATEVAAPPRSQENGETRSAATTADKRKIPATKSLAPPKVGVTLTLSVDVSAESREVAVVTLHNYASHAVDLPGFPFARDVILKLRGPGGALCERTAEGRTKLSPESQFDGEPPPYFVTGGSAQVAYVLPGENKTWTVDLAKCFEFGKGRHTLQAAVRGALRTEGVAEEVYVKSNEVEFDL